MLVFFNVMFGFTKNTFTIYKILPQQRQLQNLIFRNKKLLI